MPDSASQPSAEASAGRSDTQLEPTPVQSVQGDGCSSQDDAQGDIGDVTSHEAEVCSSQQQPASLHSANLLLAQTAEELSQIQTSKQWVYVLLNLRWTTNSPVLTPRQQKVMHSLLKLQQQSFLS